MSHVTNPPVINNYTYIFLNASFNPQQKDEINKTIEDAAELETKVNNNASKINTNLTASETSNNKRKYSPWTKAETALLMELDAEKLDKITHLFPDKTQDQIKNKRKRINNKLNEQMERAQDGQTKKRKKESEEWTPKEIKCLLELYDKYETWEEIATFFPNRSKAELAYKYNYEMKKKFDVFSFDTLQNETQISHDKISKYGYAHWTKDETALFMEHDGEELDAITHLFPDKTREQIRSKRANERKKLKCLKKANDVKKLANNVIKNASSQRSMTYWTADEEALFIKLNDKPLKKLVECFPDKTHKQISDKRKNMRKKFSQMRMEKTQDGTHTKNRIEEAATPMTIIDVTKEVATKVIDDPSNMKKHKPDLNNKDITSWTENEATLLLMQLDKEEVNKIRDHFPDKTHTKNTTKEAAVMQQEKNPYMEPRGTKSSDQRMSIDFLNDDVRPLSQNQGQKNPLNKPHAMSIGSILN